MVSVEGSIGAGGGGKYWGKYGGMSGGGVLGGERRESVEGGKYRGASIGGRMYLDHRASIGANLLCYLPLVWSQTKHTF